ncbi:AraC family transcriptional regulator [Nocardioides sp.]|uniref:AraC family transcriptional regulator n=1 Tax=Nocardioides sp. TaxID=35761 RepID=UPI002736772C|nr:AraC family transcriptional regulator [Nocardioides sp.]MDP3892673.1 AraC family transcriptional regulator [Nocardioides sp.]
MARLTTPLGSHLVLRTTSVDDARASVAASLAPHRLTPLNGEAGFRARHNAVDLGSLSFHFIDYGSAVEVAVEGLDFQLIQIPLAGTSTIASGIDVLTATPRVAAVTAVGQSLRMRYSVGNPRLMIRIAAPLLRERIARAANGGLVLPHRAGTTLDITQGPGRSWRSLVDVILADLEHERGLATAPLAASTMELAVVDGLIASLTERAGDAAAAAPRERSIRRAARLIEDHCAEPLGTPDIAEAVGLSIRALQAGFKAHLDTTPMTYLRQARLNRVRQSLLDGSATSVTEAAMRCGVTHLGRLSSDYRASFGETPRETLQRSS